MLFNRFFRYYKRKLFFFIIIFIAVVVGAEIMLRCIWGFCDAPLSMTSSKYEYIFMPSQRHRRFGNNISYNSYSQRSDEINKEKIPVLCLGDSVLNGGVQTDDSELATSIVTQKTKFQCLNISAGSWGPDNCAAYLQENGVFNSKIMILVASSHDAFDNMDFMPVVDVCPSFPNKQYLLALWELWDRYLSFKILNHASNDTLNPDDKILQGIIKKGEIFNPGFAQLAETARENNMFFSIFLHAEISEIKNKEYNEQGKLIIDWARKNNVKIFFDLDKMQGEDYRDNIHINASGQKKLAQLLKEIINLN